MINIFIQLLPIIIPTILIILLGYSWNKIGNNLDKTEINYIISWIDAPCLIFTTPIKLMASTLISLFTIIIFLTSIL